MYLYMIKKDLVKSLQIVLETKNKSLRKYTFEWIKELYKEINEEKSGLYIKEMNDFVVKIFKELFLLNREESIYLIESHLNNFDSFLFIESLAPEFDLQLNFIETMFKNKTSKFYSDKFLIYHLELLCKTKPLEVFFKNFIINLYKKVLNNLKTRDYPLDQSINLCTFYDLKEAQAFLYLRSGAIEKVYNIYLELLFDELRIIQANPFNGIKI